MEKILDEQTPAAAHAAEAEGERKGASDGGVSLGKFKDAASLLKAYESLEAEFTRRSARLKELEREAESRTRKEGSSDPSAESLAVGEKRDSGEAGGTPSAPRKKGEGKEGGSALSGKSSVAKGESDRQAEERRIIGEYLRGILSAAPPVAFGGGGRIAAPPRRPATLAEAGRLAEVYIENKKGDYLK